MRSLPVLALAAATALTLLGGAGIASAATDPVPQACLNAAHEVAVFDLPGKTAAVQKLADEADKQATAQQLIATQQDAKATAEQAVADANSDATTPAQIALRDNARKAAADARAARDTARANAAQAILQRDAARALLSGGLQARLDALLTLKAQACLVLPPTTTPAPTTTPVPTTTPAPTSSVTPTTTTTVPAVQDCTNLSAADAQALLVADPSKKNLLDPDGNGIACEASNTATSNGTVLSTLPVGGVATGDGSA